METASPPGIWTVRVLPGVSWITLAAGLLSVALTGPLNSAASQSTLTAALTIFFALLLVRIAIAVVRQRQRRVALSLLGVGVLLWSTGSAVLNGSGEPRLTNFPAPGEWFFLISYVALAAYLVSDGGRPRAARSGSILEAMIVCGGTASLAGAVLIDPVAHRVGHSGPGLLLTLLYPLLDLVLMLLVIGQIAIRLRGGLRESAALVASLALFTVADLSFIAALAAGRYDYDLVNVAMWGTAFALLVGHGCRPRANRAVAAQGARWLMPMVLAAGLSAVAVLALEPAGAIRKYLLVPALITLLAAAARMALAVRAANRAAEAFSLSRSDDLTGLPNRRAIDAELQKLLDGTGPAALMIMDLNGFKDINDTLGHPAGDLVLREVAERVNADVPSGVLVGRLGGDEFALVCECDDPIWLYEVAQAVIGTVREPIVVDGITLTVDVSIGITVRDQRDERGGELLRRADIAMYDAKHAGTGALLYDPVKDVFSRDRLALGDDLRNGIINGQLELWYQPKYDALSRNLCGLEALVRWRHPKNGVMSPAVFLPLARRMGFMLALSEAVGRIAVADMAAWRDLGFLPHVSINCAPPELMSGLFLPRLACQLRESALEPSTVTIELTEDSFLADPERARGLLLDLRNLGFEVSIDDFGTGFSSLSYLRDLPISEVKIDKSFVAAMTTDERSRRIIASTQHLVQALDLRTVAEGVEDEQTADELTELGVDVLQGYYFSRPVPAHAVPGLLRAAPTKAVELVA